MTRHNCWKTVGAIFVLCASMAVASPAQTYTVLASFDTANGSYPNGSLVQGRDGNLYGTTLGGGAFSGGEVFRITREGQLTTLYSFCAQANCLDGGGPDALVLAADGNFYGTTFSGGANEGDNGGGTFFKITPGGALTTLYNFCARPNCADGGGPLLGLQAADGNFYGVTSGGGINGCYEGGCGTAFRITRQGELTTLHEFCAQTNCTDGIAPAGLMEATDGNVYGTTVFGGVGQCSYGFYVGCGTIFKITRDDVFTTIYSFCELSNCPSGATPFAGPVQAVNGNIYGTTPLGGGNRSGTVFSVNSAGVVTALYSFCGENVCPNAPLGLVQATDRNLYGVFSQGGGGDYAGAIFNVTLGGAFATLYSFCAQPGCADGQYPDAGLVQATNGELYGVTDTGGVNGVGTVYSLSVGLGPFVAFVQAAGKVGQTGGILGQGFTGTTAVSLHGIPANFTVKSDTYITATVPPGATTGYVAVTTPSETLTSNVPFRVIP
jgi:uncharacterized repeat protein (TIGR03803 family)